MKKFTYIIILASLILPLQQIQAQSPTEWFEILANTNGRILIQVEQNGEAWYVNPENGSRYFMCRPDDAFNLMRSLGVGIRHEDLFKIPVAGLLSRDHDSDQDGLSDMVEDSFGSNVNSKDSDNDGYNDLEEVLNGYSPTGPDSLGFDPDFSALQGGKILLQVEAHGEAWYVSPLDNKRYFLGRPADAFEVMRLLGLGISDRDLSVVPAYPLIHNAIFPINEYRIFMPQHWGIFSQADQFGELLDNGETAVTYRCPIPEVGFEAWDFTELNRSFSVNSQAYGANLWIGEPKPGSEDLGKKILLFMHRGSNFAEWLEEENYQSSCMLGFSLGEEQEELAKAMYQSIWLGN